MCRSESVALPEVTDHAFASRLMMNFTVYNRTACRTLVPWRIHGVNPQTLPFEDSITTKRPISSKEDISWYVLNKVMYCPPACNSGKVPDEKLIFNKW